MKQKITTIFICIILLYFLADTSFSAVNLYVEAPEMIALDQEFDVFVKENGSGEFAGAQVTLEFDATKLQVVETELYHDVMATPQDKVNTDGKLILAYLTTMSVQSGEIPYFARIRFQAVGTGQADILFSDLSDVVAPGSINITGTKTGKNIIIKSGISGGVFTTISGQITGISNASVTIQQTGQSVTTDDQGNFTFFDVASGTYTLEIEKEGFNPLTLEDVIFADGSATIIADAEMEVTSPDVNGDNKIGLPEAIHALQVVAGVSP